MNAETIQLLFALLRSAIGGEALNAEEKALCSDEILPQLAVLAQKHDVLHLIAFGLKKNGIACGELGKKLEKSVFQAVYRKEIQEYELKRICSAFEEAHIPFIPLKGSVLRQYYPEAWMRTSCDIDILVHPADLDAAAAAFVKKCGYIEGERATHDVAFSSLQGVSVELHFDLVEESRANNAIDVLRTVWKNVSLCENSQYQYEMTDEFFYFYHIAHMAKHFENGGCGIRPFIDLWILNHMENSNLSARDGLLEGGHLLKFANAARGLSEVWLGGKEADEVSTQMQDFLLHGGVYGSTDNRVALARGKKGGRSRYLLYRVFVPYARLKRYYPILEKHYWLMPIMQVRRWFMLLKPEIRNMAKNELSVNRKMKDSHTGDMGTFLKNIGLP